MNRRQCGRKIARSAIAPDGVTIRGDSGLSAAEERACETGVLRVRQRVVVELVRLAPDVIVTTSSETALAAKQATATVPIVMAQSGDPVGVGLVASLARPGGNVTGLSSAAKDLSAKLLELLKTIAPQAGRVAVLRYPKEPTTESRWHEINRAATDLRIEVLAVDVGTPAEIDGGFATMTHQRADALVVLTTTFFIQERSRIAELAATHRLPAVYDFPVFVTAGGLVSYGADNRDLLRRAATYVDKILKGAKPSELPVEQPTKFILAVNLKAANRLGLTIPQSLLARADEVIE